MRSRPRCPVGQSGNCVNGDGLYTRRDPEESTWVCIACGAAFEMDPAATTIFGGAEADDRASVPGFEPGDAVRDALDIRDHGEEASTGVVLAVFEGERADEFEIPELEGMTVEHAAYNWPPDEPKRYDSAADCPVQVSFMTELDLAFGTAWWRWDHEQVAEHAIANEDVRVYTYHAGRLIRDDIDYADTRILG